MTHATDTPASPPRLRRSKRELDALRLLARDAALAGEPLAAIAARLKLPKTTLSDWAKADRFRRCDVQAKAARLAQQAEDTLLRAETVPPSGPARELALAKARVAVLLEEGRLPAAEDEMRAARRLSALVGFAGPMAALASVAAREGDEAAQNRQMLKIVLLTCEARHPYTPQEDADQALWMRYGSMFQHRVIIFRDVMMFGFPDLVTRENVLDEVEAAAMQGRFLGMRAGFLALVADIRARGAPALAAQVEAWAAGEEKADAGEAAFDATRNLDRAETIEAGIRRLTLKGIWKPHWTWDAGAGVLHT